MELLIELHYFNLRAVEQLPQSRQYLRLVANDHDGKAVWIDEIGRGSHDIFGGHCRYAWYDGVKIIGGQAELDDVFEPGGDVAGSLEPGGEPASERGFGEGQLFVRDRPRAGNATEFLEKLGQSRSRYRRLHAGRCDERARLLPPLEA